MVSQYSYKLDFPASVKYYHVQYVLLLDLVDNDLWPSQRNPPPPPVIVNDAEEWHVEEVLDTRMFH